MSKSREMDTLMARAMPEQIAQAAAERGCRSVAYTYNDPVIFHEYAIDVAQACREQGLKSVAVSAGYVCAEPREAFYRWMDAANIDLKSFDEDFYYRQTGAHLQPVLETLQYIRHETSVWLELTTLLIPGMNDSDQELHALCEWVVESLGREVPIHFTAFHPDYKLLDRPCTPADTLTRAREIALKSGLLYPYTGNVVDQKGGSTYCSECDELLIGREGYTITRWGLDQEGGCAQCGCLLHGVFEATPGEWGSRRLPVQIAN